MGSLKNVCMPNKPKTTTKFLVGDAFTILKWYCTMMTYLFIERFFWSSNCSKFLLLVDYVDT